MTITHLPIYDLGVAALFIMRDDPLFLQAFHSARPPNT